MPVDEAGEQPPAAEVGHAHVGPADLRTLFADVEDRAAADEQMPPAEGRGRVDVSVEEQVEHGSGVEVWRCGGVEVWRCGGVEVWRCGGVEVWREAGEISDAVAA